MSGTPIAVLGRQVLDVVCVHGCAAPLALSECIPAGHHLSGCRLRHLGKSEWIVVTDRQNPMGLAAYKRVDSPLRVVHELLLDQSLDPVEASRVTETLLSALELVAYDEGVYCLTFLLRNTVVMAPFEKRGYISLALDSSGMWLQRKFGWLGWAGMQSWRPQ